MIPSILVPLLLVGFDVTSTSRWRHVTCILFLIVSVTLLIAPLYSEESVPVHQSRSLQDCTFDDFVASRCEAQQYINTLVALELKAGGLIEGGGDVGSSWYLYWNYTGRERCFVDAFDTSEGVRYNEATFNEETGYCMTYEETETYGSGGALQTFERIMHVTKPASRQGKIRRFYSVTACGTSAPDLTRGSFSFCFNPCFETFAIDDVECLPGCIGCGPGAVDCSNVHPTLVDDCDSPFLGKILRFWEGITEAPTTTPANGDTPVPDDDATEGPVASPTTNETLTVSPTEAPVVPSTSSPVAVPATPTGAPVQAPTSSSFFVRCGFSILFAMVAVVG